MRLARARGGGAGSDMDVNSRLSSQGRGRVPWCQKPGQPGAGQWGWS